MDDQLETACLAYIKALKQQFEREHPYPYPGPPWHGLVEAEQGRIRDLLRPVLDAIGVTTHGSFSCEDCGAPLNSPECSAQCVPESECAGCHRPGEFCICP